ncbi:YkgJ family cysteine cluster protein [Desulfovibrio sp. OttesenSCG-928-A18]|nr:YkgJ family cysteine cluster protein [Desulfovibrio sp. OttesenSCG-928-A18]
MSSSDHDSGKAAFDPTQDFLQKLPEIRPGEQFWFACHPDVPCFNACCSDLTMPLTPYDVLRLCSGLKMSSEEFFEEFAVVGCYEDTGFPLLHLRMLDAPGRPCPFVTEQGCGVYEHRSSACRTYPLGRATRPEQGQERVQGQGQPQAQDRPQNGTKSPARSREVEDRAPLREEGLASARELPLVEQYFLVREGHCRGFEEQKSWTVESWLKDQSIEKYNRMNDRYMRLIARYKSLSAGALLSGRHATMALLCLYQQDRFAEFIRSVDLFSRLSLQGEHADRDKDAFKAEILDDSEARLLFAFDWLELVLFGASAKLLPANAPA